ncbi:hypothetical protein EV715DRAFT_265056, partial [Schizophyllum commune]
MNQVSADVPDGDIRIASKGHRLSEVCSSRPAPFASTSLLDGSAWRRFVHTTKARFLKNLLRSLLGCLRLELSCSRLRFLSDQASLDAASLSYVFPLLQRVVEKEAITDGGGGAYPRIGVISLVIEMAMGHSSLRRGAAETLVAVGETIAASAEAKEQLTGACANLKLFALAHETAALLAGTLSAEAYARQACLNALVPFDLTALRGGTAPEGELDASVTGAKSLAAFGGTTATHAGANAQVVASPFDASLVGDNRCPALWLACHDVEDEKNVDLARGIWEDNGLDVPDLGEAWTKSNRSSDSLSAGRTRSQGRQGRRPLGDREAAVRRAMLDAGVAVIDIHGGDAKVLPPLIAMFEAQLAAGSGGTPA